MHSTDAVDGTAPQPSTTPRKLIELRTGEVIAEITPNGTAQRAFTAADVAAQLTVSERYVKTLIETGELKSVKLAGRRLVLAEDLDAFIETLKKERDAAQGAA